MARFSQYVIAAAGVCVVTTAGTLVSEPQAVADPSKVTPVEIVSPVPLPVHAQITSSVPLSVDANVVSSVPLVTYAPPAAPSEPFSASVSITINDGTTGNNASLAVPDGKRLVIEEVAGSIFLPGGQVVRVTTIRTDFSFLSFPLAAVPVAGQSDSVTIVSQAMKLYADSDVTFSVSRAPSSAGDGFCFFSISGYLVDR